MAITKEQAIDILDMMDFFQGQRAGRELWVEKPFEVQEQDISNFSKNVHLLKEYITSDVAPRAEVARLVQDVTRLEQENETLKDGNEHLAVMLEEAKDEANRYKRYFFRHDYDEMIAEVLDSNFDV